MVAKLQELKAALRRRMHEPTALVGPWLRKVVLGYYQYHAVPGNLDRLGMFQYRLRRLWRHILFRRSQKGRKSWKRLRRLLDRWIPLPRALHPYPMVRFCAIHPKYEPDALAAQVRICAGGAG